MTSDVLDRGKPDCGPQTNVREHGPYLLSRSFRAGKLSLGLLAAVRCQELLLRLRLGWGARLS